MWLTLGFFFLLFKEAGACTCDGVEIAQSDQKHCYQIIRNTGNSWVTADEKCASMGGFLAHFNSTTLYNQLNSYISENYEVPLMTGATVANVELDLVALMCPSNSFYSLLSNSFVASFFEGEPTTANRCTFIVSNSTNKLQYMPCDTNADILCDRPMENTNYCNIKMNCTETSTTSAFLTTPTKTTTNSQTSSTTILGSNSSTSTSGSSSTLTGNLINTTSVSISTTTATPLPITSSTSQSFTSPTQTTSNFQSTTPLPTTTTTFPTSTKTNPTTKTTQNGVTNNPTGTNPTASTWQTLSTSTPIAIGPTSSNSESCGDGYTRIFGWCVPWWCWLIFGLLLLGLLLCCLSWLCHFCCAACLCSHKKEAPHEEILEREREDAICQTDPFVIPSNETVYIPVPKTPPLPHIAKEKEPPINTHTILHTHEIIREKSFPQIPPPPPVVYDVTIYENAFNTNTVLVPPIVQESQPSPNIFIPPTSFESRSAIHPRVIEDDIISANSIPFFPEDFRTPSPLPLYTKDESDPVPFLPILAAPPTMPVLALKAPKMKKPRRHLSPLKYNRPPNGNGNVNLDDQKPDDEFPKKREFPKPPPRDSISTPPERAFPKPSPQNRSPTISPKKLAKETFEHPIRKNTPLNLNRQPERLSVTPPPKSRSPVMPRLPTRSPFEVPSPRSEIKPSKKRAASPPVTFFEPPNSLPHPPKQLNQRRISPMNDSPPRLNTSPRKFRTPSPKAFADDITGKSISTPASSKQQQPRRRQSLGDSEAFNQSGDVSMRAPRGRLGEANDKPDGWKPWAKNSQLFSGHPGFLDN